MQRGELVQWNDVRGFGFILADDDERYFVHISNIGRIATRPRVGDLVTFAGHTDENGRLEARSVSIQGANPKATLAQMRRGTEVQTSRSRWRPLLATLLAALILLGFLLGRLPWYLAVPYIPMGLFALAAYGRDKRLAENGEWRTSEVTLLGLDLSFGILGGLVGQEIFRHKTRKPEYVATTVLISAVHLLWLGGLMLGLFQVGELTGLGAELLRAIGL
jgi:uncharacterized membrane protein YsdA (DUF1294 family)/cold shock CspA family protein